MNLSDWAVPENFAFTGLSGWEWSEGSLGMPAQKGVCSHQVVNVAVNFAVLPGSLLESYFMHPFHAIFLSKRELWHFLENASFQIEIRNSDTVTKWAQVSVS